MASQSQSLKQKIDRIADLHAELAVLSRETDREVKGTARVIGRSDVTSAKLRAF